MTTVTSQRPPRIAVLGLGEAGKTISRDLVAAGADVRGYDPRVPAPDGVSARGSDADAVRDADLVLCLTTAHEAESAIRTSLSKLPATALWADLNAASPRQKVCLTELAPAISVIDVAIMAPVPGRGLRTPMVASGPKAPEFAEALNRFGGCVQVLDGPVGAASSRKLLRSVFYKGLSAAVIEALAGAEAAGCRDWLYDNISQELANFTPATIDRLVNGTHRHAKRRMDEMAAAAEQLIDLGVPARVASAARDQLAAMTDEQTADH